MYVRLDLKISHYLLILFVFSSLVLPLYSKFHRSRPPKRPTTKAKKPPKYEEDSDNTSSLSNIDTAELPNDLIETDPAFEIVRQDLLNSTGEGRGPNPLPEPISNKKLLAVMKRDLVEDLITKMVMTLANRDPDKIKYLISDQYHVNAVDTDCYNRTMDEFSNICINIEKNPYINRFVNIFVNICDAEWLSQITVKNVMKEVCRGINKYIADTV